MCFNNGLKKLYGYEKHSIKIFDLHKCFWGVHGQIGITTLNDKEAFYFMK